MLRPEQERVRQLLTEAVTLLCRNSLHFEEEVTVEGLLGITLDRHDIFLVSIRETVKQALKEVAPNKGEKRVEADTEDSQPAHSAKRRKMLEHRRDSGGSVSPKPSPRIEASQKNDDSSRIDNERLAVPEPPSVSHIKREVTSVSEDAAPGEWEPSSEPVDERKFNPAHDSTITMPSSQDKHDSRGQTLDSSEPSLSSGDVCSDSHQPSMSTDAAGVQVKQEQVEDEEECYLVESDSEEHSDNSHSSSMPIHAWPTGTGDGSFNLSEIELLAAQQFSQSGQFGNISGSSNIPFPITGEIPVAGPSSLDGSQRISKGQLTPDDEKRQMLNRKYAYEYRKRVKGNPEKVEAIRRAAAERRRIYQANLSDEQRARQRELGRLRKRRQREKKKQGGKPVTQNIGRSSGDLESGSSGLSRKTKNRMSPVR